MPDNACSPHRFRVRMLTALLGAMLLPAMAGAAGVIFLPGATRDDAIGQRPALDLLTWELADGLLVADRLGPAGMTRFGAPLPAVAPDGHWFLVRRQAGRGAPAAGPSELARHGRVHLELTDACVVEIAPADLEAFFASAYCLNRIELSPPPPTPAAPLPAGQPRTRAVDPALKQAFVDALDAQAYYQLIRELSGYDPFFFDGASRTITTRYYSTASKNLAGGYLAAKLAGYGYAVEFDTFLVGSVVCRNIVATSLGSTAPAEFVVVGGHYDSTSPQPTTAAPGAEDNASGTSLVMEIARASAGRDFDRTVQFVLFDSEEQGLNGSYHFVQEAVAAGRQLVAAITADMVAYYSSNYGVRIEGQTAWEWLMSAMADNVVACSDIAYRKDYHSYGSDHVPFQQAGIAAFLAIDWDWASYPFYHSTGDGWRRIENTAHLGHQIARAAAGTLADVAGLRPDATGVQPPAARRVSLSARPNPFNPRVELRFGLAFAAAGDLAVYDAAGRRVATLATGPFAAGEHVVGWDGSGRSGRALPSGLYVCRLATTAGAASVKLNLTR